MSQLTFPGPLAADAFSIEGLTINLPTPDTASSEVIRRARLGQGFTLFTLNLDHVAKLRWSPAFLEAYRRATYVTADGWPIVWLAGRKGLRLQRTTGADLVEPLCAAIAAQGIGAYFVGPARASQVAALAILQKRYPGLTISDAEAPWLSADLRADEIDALAERIKASGARICFVALGAPKQELVADALLARCPEVGFLCVGAAFDFISGAARRAPLWMQSARLEWLWRVANEPRRLAARYLECAYVFVRLTLGVGLHA